VGASYHPEFFRTDNSGKAHEVTQVILVRAPRLPIGDVGEPLNLRRHVREVEKFFSGQGALLAKCQGR
jgi:hypothetical protein